MNKNEKPKYGFIDRTRMRIAKRIDDYMLKDNLDSYRNALVNSNKLIEKHKLSDEDNDKFADLIAKRNKDIAVVSRTKNQKVLGVLIQNVLRIQKLGRDYKRKKE